MEETPTPTSRKKFLLWTASVITSVTALKYLSGRKLKEAPATTTMLTQDGKLVTINMASLPSKKKKISNKELQDWIKK
ncbi:MAG: hypothetical protein ABIY51_02770 [Ferruginibacter sp.]